MNGFAELFMLKRHRYYEDEVDLEQINKATYDALITAYAIYYDTLRKAHAEMPRDVSDETLKKELGL